MRKTFQGLESCYDTVRYLQAHYPVELESWFGKACRCSPNGTLHYPPCIFTVDMLLLPYAEKPWQLVRIAFWNKIFADIEDESIKMELFLQGLL